MFIERLTKEQLCSFFKTKDLSYFVSSGLYEEEAYLYVSIDGDSMSRNYRLYDFEGSTVSRQSEWRKFLYGIFGDEYKRKYKKYLYREAADKLACLDE